MFFVPVAVSARNDVPHDYTILYEYFLMPR